MQARYPYYFRRHVFNYLFADEVYIYIIKMYKQDRKVIGCKAAYKVKPPKTNPQEHKKWNYLTLYQPLIPSQGKNKTKNT